MSRIAPALMASAAKGLAQGQPGSNGYWRREIYRIPGTYTWTATKDGKVKIQGLGTGAGGKRLFPGPSGAFGEKTLTVTAGQTLTIVIGQGSLGSSEFAGAVAQGGTTSVSGAPVGGTPLVLVGARNPSTSATDTIAASEQVPGTGTGPWDISFPGATFSRINTGGPSSGSPFGPGYPGPLASQGGSGWGGQAVSGASSSHYPGTGARTNGLLSTTAPLQFWDMRDVDSPSGEDGNSTNAAAINGGPGAGGGRGPTNVESGGGASAFGGGTGFSVGNTGNSTGRKGGNGAGGGGVNVSSSPANLTGGAGGDGLIFLFWDEVA